MIQIGKASSIAGQHRAQQSPVALAGAAEGQILLIAQEGESLLFEPALAGIVPGQIQMREFCRADRNVFLMRFAQGADTLRNFDRGLPRAKPPSAQSQKHAAG